VQVEQGSMKRIGRVTGIGAQGGMRLTVLFDPEQAVIRKPMTWACWMSSWRSSRRSSRTARESSCLLLPRWRPHHDAVHRHPDARRVHHERADLRDRSAVRARSVRTNAWTRRSRGPRAAPELSSAPPSARSSVATRCRCARRVARREHGKEVAKADHERTRVYVSMRANDALSQSSCTSRRGRYEARRGLAPRCVAQRLVRKLCSNCASPIRRRRTCSRRWHPEGRCSSFTARAGRC